MRNEMLNETSIGKANRSRLREVLALSMFYTCCTAAPLLCSMAESYKNKSTMMRWLRHSTFFYCWREEGRGRGNTKCGWRLKQDGQWRVWGIKSTMTQPVVSAP